MDKLTLKQRRFVDAYMGAAAGNATEAARIAGYAGTNGALRVTGSRLLKHDRVLAEIEKRKDALNKEFLMSSYITINPMIRLLLYDAYGGSPIKATRAIEKIIVGLFGDNERMITRSGLIREPISSDSRYDILYRAGFKCQACGAKPKSDNDVELHIDHIVPVSFGGSNDHDNLQVLCAECNLSKGNRFMYNHNDDDEDSYGKAA